MSGFRLRVKLRRTTEVLAEVVSRTIPATYRGVASWTSKGPLHDPIAAAASELPSTAVMKAAAALCVMALLLMQATFTQQQLQFGGDTYASLEQRHFRARTGMSSSRLRVRRD